MRLLVIPILVLSLVPLPAGAETIAQAAQREKERREKLAAEGRGASVIDDEALQAGRPEDKDGTASVAPATTATAGAPAGKATEVPPENAEAAWRKRAVDIDARIAAAEKEYEEVVHETAEVSVDAQGRLVYEDRGDRRASAKVRVQEARRAREVLEEDARRAGIPPGWLR